MDLPDRWGVRPDELATPLPCDALAPPGARALWRGVTVAAPPAVVFRWLCQLRVAPYSYDWIDNRGRRSPRTRSPELEELDVGQTVMSIFELVAFERDRHLTLRNRSRGGARSLFGEVWVSYAVTPEAEGRSRLLGKLRFVPPPGLWGRFVNAALGWGDWVMMRKQLLTLKELAEREAARGSRT